MDNDLVSIYENAYLRGNVIEEKKPVFEKEDEDETAPKPSSKKKGKFVAKKGKKKSMSKELGGITYDSFNRSETVFDKILREMNEMGGGASADVGDDNNVFDTGDDYDLEDSGDSEQTFTLSELRSMTLGDLVDLLSGGDDEYELDDSGAEGFEDDLSEEDDIPQESYGFTGGEGNYKGDQGNYDGKAKRQPATRFVKANGDADFSQTETGYDPEETDGNEESNYKGDQGNYDGKAKRQPATNFVKSNGDTDFGKNKTGHKTSSGKKDKNYF